MKAAKKVFQSGNYRIECLKLNGLAVKVKQLNLHTTFMFYLHIQNQLHHSYSIGMPYNKFSLRNTQFVSLLCDPVHFVRRCFIIPKVKNPHDSDEESCGFLYQAPSGANLISEFLFNSWDCLMMDSEVAFQD